MFEGDIDKDVPPTFEDGKTTKVVPGQGTYTIDPNGKVKFTPEPEFVGTASGVTVVRKDKNGKTIFASYTRQFVQTLSSEIKKEKKFQDTQLKTEQLLRRTSQDIDS